MIITFCGHADARPTQEQKLKLMYFFENHINDRHAQLYLGGYGNFDHFSYVCGKEYKILHPNTELIFVTPYLNEQYQRNKFRDCLNQYDAIVYPELENVPPRVAIIRRNQWMIDRADFVVTYITRRFGGAYNTYRYALKEKKPIFHLTEMDIE